MKKKEKNESEKMNVEETRDKAKIRHKPPVPPSSQVADLEHFSGFSGQFLAKSSYRSLNGYRWHIIYAV